jgi:type VI secretion system secreted protein VgrG
MATHATDLWDMVHQAKGVLASVEYDFRSDGWQGAPWHVRRVRLVEALSELYQLTVDLVVDDVGGAVDPVLGSSCELTIRRGAASRSVCGLVLALDDIGELSGRRLVRAQVGPALALLGQRQDTRSWQDKTGPEILQAVLGEALGGYKRTVRLELASDEYVRREYCSQFRETDLDFAARLMEEEGISYFFEHESGGEVLVLVDHNARFPALSSRADGDAVPILDTEWETAALESVQSFTWTRRLHGTSVAQRDWDFVRPDGPRAYEERGTDDAGRDRESYFHDEQVFMADGARRARLRREQLAAHGKTARGGGNATLFQPGLRFRLVDHRRDELDRLYVLTRVVHTGDCPEVVIEQANAPAGPRYANEFECTPDDVPLRPARQRMKPRVHGPTTATVVGPASEEVHTDEHGRIKVLFPWDRLSPADDAASWWVRVAQGSAGAGWGQVFIPRIGMEVVVEFLDGDPDRPLVTGCVYNGRNPPPYALPGDKTKSTIKSNSSPSNGGYNELRFEDQQGCEEVYLQAERDWNTLVKLNKTLTVGGNEVDTVAMNRVVTVALNDALTVGMNRAETVGMNRAVTVGMNNAVTVGMNQTETIAIAAARTIGAAYQVSVGAAMNESIGLSKSESIGEYKSVSTGKSSSEDVGEDKTMYVAENSAETVGKDKSVDAGENLMQSAGKSVSVSAGERMTLSAGDDLTVVGEKRGLIVIEDQLVIRVGEAAIVMKKNGDILISGAKITVTGTGDVKVKGSKVAAN